MISERLKSALNTEETVSSQEKSVPSNVEQATEDGSDNKIITTEEEIESYIIVKSILRPFIDISRVVYRDAQTYFAVLLDDNNRKPICRMYFNGLTKNTLRLSMKTKRDKT